MNTHKPVHRVFASVALAATLALLPATASVAQAQGVRNAGISVPITGSAMAADGSLQTLTGMLTIQRFSRAQRHIFAEGTLVGTLTSDIPGSVPQTVVTQVAMPLQMPGATATATDVTALAVSCDILNLVLAPLDLNLLGLTVHLNQVVLNIVAVTGAGNLLGNLLCAITGLLNGGGPLASIVALLNSLLAILG